MIADPPKDYISASSDASHIFTGSFFVAFANWNRHAPRKLEMPKWHLKSSKNCRVK
jgi:hypothetical protein